MKVPRTVVHLVHDISQVLTGWGILGLERVAGMSRRQIRAYVDEVFNFIDDVDEVSANSATRLEVIRLAPATIRRFSDRVWVAMKKAEH